MTRIISLLTALALSLAARELEIHFIDVEGGQATLIVSPSGESLLVDAGWPGFNNRDADRIIAAAKKSGLSAIDYLMVTHHHRDHVGGVEQLAAKFPVRTFVDDGENRETGKGPEELNASYAKALATGKHLKVRPGDKIPVKGLDITVLTADGERIDKPVAGGGAANPACAGAQKKADDPTENARSVGILVKRGKFRFVDLGDLTWNKEIDLVCPTNRIGEVDVYLTTHHGMDISGPAQIVHALKPRVAIMNNGAKKGASPSAWQVIKNSPGLEDFWQVHFAVAAGKENNVAEDHIANLDENCKGLGLSIVAKNNGEFTVANERNGLKKTYRAR
jgi:beta-lactamase superfamily II metal-dependent hydrolase